MIYCKKTWRFPSLCQFTRGHSIPKLPKHGGWCIDAKWIQVYNWCGKLNWTPQSLRHWVQTILLELPNSKGQLPVKDLSKQYKRSRTQQTTNSYLTTWNEKLYCTLLYYLAVRMAAPGVHACLDKCHFELHLVSALAILTCGQRTELHVGGPQLPELLIGDLGNPPPASLSSSFPAWCLLYWSRRIAVRRSARGLQAPTEQCTCPRSTVCSVGRQKCTAAHTPSASTIFRPSSHVLPRTMPAWGRWQCWWCERSSSW